jgi:uncharacterized protein
MLRFYLFLTAMLLSLDALSEGARRVFPEYQPPKVVYEFYLDDPAKLSSALYWIRSLMNPLIDSPYDMAPEFMQIKVVLHGTEIVALVKKNHEKYREEVERMRYYASLGVEFKVCSLAAGEYGYETEDFQPFVEIVPSAFTELVHWQQQGYALITPQVPLRRHSLDEIR